MASTSSTPAKLPGAPAVQTVDTGISSAQGGSRSSQTRIGEAWRGLPLLARVHADAFSYDPAGYLQGLFWRVRGLRVRSRTRIAALAGRSPHAYDLWISRREPELRRAFPRNADFSFIQPIIDCRHSTAGLSVTLSSLKDADSRDPIVIDGGQDSPVTAKAWSDLPQGPSGGHWICRLAPGDTLAPDALAIYAAVLARDPSAGVIYADDDLLDGQGNRSDPHFKPDWNADLFRHHDFMTGACIIRLQAEDRPVLVNGSGLDQLLRIALKREPRPAHLPLILHHQRSRPEPLPPAEPVSTFRGRLPKVSVIIPTRNKAALLRKCMEGLRGTDYPNFEIIVVDNGSDQAEALDYLRMLEREGVAVLRDTGPFNFSALNNNAVRQASGELLCFLNNDVEMMGSDWLTALAAQAVREDVGAVGARLLYPDGTIQHAGVFLGIGGGAGHGHRYLPAEERGYFHRASLPQRVSAVTGACLVVAREKFLAVGGFDEVDFPVAFNDVDLCLKLRAQGWEALYEPRATLIHHESKSRGSDSAKNNRERFKGELAALKRKWRTDRQPDPYHHPQLSPFTEQFLIAV